MKFYRVNNEFKGNSPIQVKVKRNKQPYLIVRKEGFITEAKTIGTRLSSTGVADIVGAFLIIIPGIGLFFPGAWELKETNLFFHLTPEN